ncbi:metalloregulator ArsR/SmtB family transcription factor [Actinoplanes auranticolor]|uniref:metalloregulator ArsR/SmtB family transcription factor n=1 Tax=Actinoplanes auranticolor TaxID=47988 RepID=UPI0031E774CA
MAAYRAGDGWDVLADPSRRSIVTCLADRPRAVGELADDLAISRPAVSQHLKVRKDAGLVTDEAAGTRRVYRLNPAGVDGNASEEKVMAEPAAVVVQRQIVIEAPFERAFVVFTERFGDFKPPGHNLLGTPIAETVFERKVGGYIYDRATDGTECRWARMLAYEPPDRVVFSWDISPQWQGKTDSGNTSEVEVRFIAETPHRTRVELEHRHLDRHGPGWESVRDGVAHDEGWPLYLARYAALFTQDL